ncbi:hypothetical protein DICVIV_11193 [Dictyocaulus viviparus]|uniref:G-protein coupled receptors family 1 profile domain-containing protein n=1 Tax=Dictyocaulus viviparus TaxID=29172 RepID=A0A0D8XDV8_DICVI|nr:hypothetical protein DICVIV_11193 [Dictyocaulus viviparus]
MKITFQITYAYIAPVIITCGIIGDILTVITLTHPLLRKSTIVYTYLTLLAMTDLLTHFSVIPMILWLLDIRSCSATASFFYAHIGFPLASIFNRDSMMFFYILHYVHFLTLKNVLCGKRMCYSINNLIFRSRKVCFILFTLAYVFNFTIYAPWAFKKEVHNLKEILEVVELPQNLCPYIVCDSRKADWFMIYEATRELISRIFPFFLVAYMNIKILITYRNTKKDRMQRLANSQKRFVYEKSEREEKRLFVLLFAIIIVFFLCTIPAAPLTILVADSKSNNLPFQIFRAVVNLLEFTKFALNFYFYCLINPDIRRICIHVITCKKISRPPRVKGQPTTPISFYTRSTKNSTIRGRNGSSRRSSSVRNVAKGDDGATRKDSGRRNMAVESPVAKLTVIRESDSQNSGVGDQL